MNIASIAREAGLSIDVLRKWETRYGFPCPTRNGRGHRVYDRAQVARLQRIKRLMDLGMRPSQVVPLSDTQLLALLAGQDAELALDSATDPFADEVLHALRSRELPVLLAKLSGEIGQHGLERFVLERVPELNRRIGAAWEAGDIAVRDEHVYTEAMQNLLRLELSRLPAARADAPRLLLTTPSGELHTLGILMVQVLATLHGAACLSLGAQTPSAEIPLAIEDFGADVLCLCFSGAFPRRQILPLLLSLRRAIPRRVDIWIGGAGAAGPLRLPAGVRGLQTLPQMLALLATTAWPGRQAQSASPGANTPTQA